MREIRFRAWDKTNKTFINWNGIKFSELNSFINDLYDLQQFTGLLDKNGKEIYEGDIMKYLVHYPIDFQETNPLKKHGRITGGVQWIKGWLWLDYNAEKDDGTLLYEKSAEEWEVIGNIYENPELLIKASELEV